MSTVRKVVNILDPDYNLVTLHPGDEIPEWALERITNPAVIALEPPRVEPDPDEGQDNGSTEGEGGEQIEAVAPAGYAALTKDALVALLNERTLDAKGNKPVLVARLEEADKAAAGEVDEPVDVWTLDEAELRQLAEARNVDVTGANSTAELATALQLAEQ